MGAEVAALQEKLQRYEAACLEQKTTIQRLEAEKKETEAALKAYRAGPPVPAALPQVTAPPQPATRLAGDVADLEARKTELSAALSQIEDLLQLKIKDLTRRIARIYEEAGDSGAGRDFRRISNQLEASGNFGEFIRALLGE